MLCSAAPQPLHHWRLWDVCHWPQEQQESSPCTKVFSEGKIMHKAVKGLLFEKGVEAWTFSVEKLLLAAMDGSKSSCCFSLGCHNHLNITCLCLGNEAAKSGALRGRRGTRQRDIMSARLLFFERSPYGWMDDVEMNNNSRRLREKPLDVFFLLWWGREE